MSGTDIVKLDHTLAVDLTFPAKNTRKMNIIDLNFCLESS